MPDYNEIDVKQLIRGTAAKLVAEATSFDQATAQGDTKGALEALHNLETLAAAARVLLENGRN